jgi:hypothetical protein
MAVLAMEQMAHVVRSLAPRLTGTDDVTAPWALCGDARPAVRVRFDPTAISAVGSGS